MTSINKRIAELKNELNLLNVVKKSNKSIDELIYDRNLLVQKWSQMIAPVEVAYSIPTVKAPRRRNRSFSENFKKQVILAYENNMKISVIRKNFNLHANQLYTFLRQAGKTPNRTK